MPFTKLNQLLGKSIKRAGISEQVHAAQVMETFNAVADKIFGRSVGHKLKPLYIKNGTLTVACISSVLGEKLKSVESQMLFELNKPYRKRVVERLRFLS